MRLLMLTGDRNVAIGEKGPFWSMQAEFSKHFERIDVFCPRPDRPVVVDCIHDNVHFHTAPVGRHRMVRWIAREGARLIAELGHGLITSHDYGWFYNGLGAARLTRSTGVPYVSEIHHVPGVPVAADRREVLDRFVARRYVRWARARARAFRVVNSAQMPSLLKSWGVPAEQILVLGSLYIDLETFLPAAVRPAPKQDVVYVGRMVNNKGLDRIVDALALLKRRAQPTSALLLGRGPMRAATEERVRCAGLGELVRFLDWVDAPSDLAQIYRESRSVVCASTCEGGPRFTVEAMACGTPAVSTRVRIMEELLVEGQNGALADWTAEGLADALWRVLGEEDKRLALGVRAHTDVQRFEYASALRGYAEGLKELVNQGAIA